MAVERLRVMLPILGHWDRARQVVTGHRPDERVGAREGKQDRRDAPKDIRSETQAGDLRDHHVLRIADKGGGRADVARDRERNEKRHGIDLPADQRGRDDRRENKADNVVIEKG